MQDWKEKIKMWACILPACLMITGVVISLNDYKKPVYKVKAAKDVVVAKESEKETTDADVNFDDIEIELPPTVASAGKSSSASKKLKTAKDVSGYKNGTYYGSGNGFAGEIKVKVVVKKGKIKEIKVIESNDGASYIASASALLKDIIKKQSTNVDTVSGATYSSVGLIEAVRDALKDAGLSKKDKSKKDKSKKNKSDDSKTKPEDKTADRTTEEQNTETQVPVDIPEGRVPYKDGTYIGVGEGYKGDIIVSVTIKDKTIREIVVTETKDDEAFFNKAKNLLNDILAKQDANVDTVSGATFSSKGLIEAVSDALLQAKKATESEEPQELKEDTADNNKKEEEKQNVETVIEDTPKDSIVPEEPKMVYKDGTYTFTTLCNPDANGDFQPYTLSLTLTVKDNRIDSISDIYQVDEGGDDNSWYIDRAVNGTKKNPGVVAKIKDNGSVEGVDAVSGATCSSNAIIAAVRDLLESIRN